MVKLKYLGLGFVLIFCFSQKIFRDYFLSRKQEYKLALALHGNGTNYVNSQDLDGSKKFNPDLAAKLDYLCDMYHDHRVNCAGLMEIKNRTIYNEHLAQAEFVIADNGKIENNVTDSEFLKTLNRETRDCHTFISRYGFIMDHLSEDEKHFPIAYSLITYKTPEHAVRLLRAMYRPSNYYCIHVDRDHKSDLMHAALSAMAECFPNVFMSSRRALVGWGYFSVLEAEFICMEDMWKFEDWKYFINLVGTEFPLKNNYEIVQILKSYRGANDVRGTHKYARKKHWNWPHNLTAYKAPVHITVNRDFVDFVLHHQIAQDLKAFLEPHHMSDESFFGLLNHNIQLGIHGSFIGQEEAERKNPLAGDELKQSFSRYKIWNYNHGFCAKGKDGFKRAICMLTTGDLPYMYKSPALIANKIQLHEDRVIIGCLEEWNMNKTRDYYRGTRHFNTSIYANSDLVKHMLVNDPLGKWNTS